VSLDPGIAGETTLPRRNGELVFEEPWESRAFGLAVALHHAGVVEWEAFRARLIDAISAREREPREAEGWNYYARWHEALETLIVERGLVAPDEIERRAVAIAHERAHDHGA
jgi:nitrile hydratase accessory protein